MGSWRVGPVRHAGGGFVYTAISNGLQSENTYTSHHQMPADPSPSVSPG